MFRDILVSFFLCFISLFTLTSRGIMLSWSGFLKRYLTNSHINNIYPFCKGIYIIENYEDIKKSTKNSYYFSYELYNILKIRTLS